MTEKFPIEIGGGVPLASLTAIQVHHSGLHAHKWSVPPCMSGWLYVSSDIAYVVVQKKSMALH